MDVRYINPFILSVKTVFSTMLKTEIVVSKPVLKAADEHASDVSAVIGLSGDAVGSVVLSFPMATAVRVASTFAGVEMTANHPDFSDALGELANMVAGQAKARFEGLNASISLPSVIIGKEHVVSQSRQTPRLALPCDSVLGRFSVEVALLVNKQKSVGAAAPVMAGAKG
jgi:chemotaxis protein CheX